jgi:hypothetical protein
MGRVMSQFIIVIIVQIIMMKRGKKNMTIKRNKSLERSCAVIIILALML